MGTIGGNIANGSPIGDTPPAADRARRDADAAQGRGAARRCRWRTSSSPTASRTGGRASSSRRSSCRSRRRARVIAAYKITKRRDEDISAVLAAFQLRLEDGTVADGAASPIGGMAATPKRARRGRGGAARQALDARPRSRRRWRRWREDFTPITDWRASADYRAQVARNLLRRFLLETTARGAADREAASADQEPAPMSERDPRRRARRRSATTAPHKHVTGEARLYRRHARAGRARCTPISGSATEAHARDRVDRPDAGARRARRRRRADRRGHSRRERHQPDRHATTSRCFADGPGRVPRPADLRGRRRDARRRRGARRSWPRSSTRSCRRHRRRASAMPTRHAGHRRR